MLLVFIKWCATASQSAVITWPLVYFVLPSNNSDTAVEITGSGVGNPGSPTVHLITPSGGVGGKVQIRRRGYQNGLRPRACRIGLASCP